MKVPEGENEGQMCIYSVLRLFLFLIFVHPVSDSLDLHSCLFFVHFTIFIKILDLYSFYNFENFILSLHGIDSMA